VRNRSILVRIKQMIFTALDRFIVCITILLNKKYERERMDTGEERDVQNEE
jgi:hypothetical protein